MWLFDFWKSKEISKNPRYDLETILGPDPMKENTLMTEEIKAEPSSPEQEMDQAIATVQAQETQPISIINGYADWTDTTVASLTESRNTLAGRIERDQEELRQIDKVIEGMKLMRDTIVSEEPSFQTSEPSEKPRTRRKPSPVEMAS